MTTYTVINPNTGEVLGRGLSATDAAAAILTDDGYAYEVRERGDIGHYELFVSDGSANSTRGARHMNSTILSIGGCYAAGRDAAWAELAGRVLTAGWNGPEAMTDAAYDAMLAELEAELEAE
jgi:hypothetical protein